MILCSIESGLLDGTHNSQVDNSQFSLKGVSIEEGGKKGKGPGVMRRAARVQGRVPHSIEEKTKIVEDSK